MTNRLGLYLFRQLLTAFLFAGVAVTIVVLFTQMFRLLSLVIDNSSTLWIFFQLMGLSVPTFLPLVLPLGLAVGVTFVYHKLAIDSELVILRAAGISPMRQAMPALVLATIVMIICYALTLWLTPAANRELVALQYSVRDNFSVFLARPGNFNDITDGLTFYARERGSNGELQGILLHDVRKPDNTVTIMADKGQMLVVNGQPQIVVFNGKRQEMDRTTGHLDQLTFDRYVLDLQALRGAETLRLPDPREQTLQELLNPSLQMLKNRASPERLMAELQQRLATPLLAISYALIGLTTILAGEFNRRGMSKRILIAALSVTIVQAATLSTTSLITKESWLALVLYIVVLAPTPLCLILLNSKILRKPVPATALAAAATT